MGGAAPDCDDSNVCTDDSCNPTTGCVHTPGNAGTVCRPSAGDCDVAETCTGTSPTCPADAYEPDDTVCDDDDACTSGDMCTAGICAGVAVACPACQTCESGLGCVAAPRDLCLDPVEPFKALLLLKHNTNDSRDKLIWKWIKGEETVLEDFGDPLTRDDYTLCIYETVGEQPSVLLSATAPAGGQCAGRDCWKALSTTGFRYKDKELTPDGLDTIILKAGDDGKAKIIVKGKGAGLILPSPLDVELPVTVQLQSTNGECWQAGYFPVGVKKNEADMFKAKAGSPSGAFIEATSGLLD